MLNTVQTNTMNGPFHREHTSNQVCNRMEAQSKTDTTSRTTGVQCIAVANIPMTGTG